MRWEAIRDSVWTFDTGVGSAIKEPGGVYPGVDPFKPDGFHAYMEGWTGLDRTAADPSTGQQFRRLSALDPRWAPGSPCVGSQAGLGGMYSLWAGVFPEEAADLCYVSGQGYGNRWSICIGRSFRHPGGAGPVTLEYDYRNDTEADFDFTTVRAEKAGTILEVASYTGFVAGHEVAVLGPGTGLPQGSTPLTITFCISSDALWSDEDGLTPTACGAFAVDDIRLSGGITHLADFEADDGGWALMPSGPAPGGDWSRLMHLENLPPLPGSTAGHCTLLDSVLVLFDPSTGAHSEMQDNVVISPWIDLGRAGATGYPGKLIELDGYFDLPFLNYVFVVTKAQWFPYVCPNTGETKVSPWSSYWLQNFGGVPTCLDESNNRRASFSTVMPDEAEEIRIAVGVINYCRFYSNCLEEANSTPWFDNLRFAVHTTNTLQSLLDAATEGDTIRVPPGTYTGPGYRDLDFGGKNLVLLGVGGPEVTILDCEHAARGFLFQSGEDSRSVVEGFTIRNGRAPPKEYGGLADGGGILVTNESRPTIRDCVITGCEGGLGGGVRVWYGSGISMSDCVISANHATTGGGLFGGPMTLNRCTITENVAEYDGGGASLSGHLTACSIIRNRALGGSGGGLTGGQSFGCTISENEAFRDGGGLSYGSAEECTVTGNHAGRLGGGVSTPWRLTRCTMADNSADGGGGAFMGGGRMENCQVLGNVARLGGGVYGSPGFELGGPPEIAGTVIAGNVADEGGGILAEHSGIAPFLLELSGSTVSGNRAHVGGGVRVRVSRMEVVASYSILWGNCADSVGAEIYAPDTSMTVTLECCAIDSSGIAVQGSLRFAGTPISTDPQLCLASPCAIAPTVAGEYSLASSSPCLPGQSPCGSLVGAVGEGCTTTGVEDEVALPAPALAAYPNPFQGALTLLIPDLAGRTAWVQVFDVGGRLVWSRELEATISGGNLQWNGMDRSGAPAAGGIYFVHLRSASLDQTVRVVKLP